MSHLDLGYQFIAYYHSFEGQKIAFVTSLGDADAETTCPTLLASLEGVLCNLLQNDIFFGVGEEAANSKEERLCKATQKEEICFWTVENLCHIRRIVS